MLTETIAAFASEPLGASRKGREIARRMIETAVARAIENAASEPAQIAFDAVSAFETKPVAAVFGRDALLAPQWAAFVNGISSHTAIVPAALALAQARGVGGDALLDAVVAATEIDLRLVEAVAPEHADRGWDPAGTIGHFGAALAAGRVLALDAGRMRNAIGIAATQAAGLWAAFGTMTQAYHFGKAAADGVEAALLAEAGFTGPAQPIEGRRGFAALCAKHLAEARVTEGLGSAYRLDRSQLEAARPGERVRAVLDRFGLG